MKLLALGTINVDLDVTGQWLSHFLYPSDTGEKLGVYWYSTSAIIGFKKVCDSVRREASH
jgi:hypothetical protein